LRNDEIVEVISKKEALKNAPSKDSDYFKVPKFINK
jgi:aspartyl/glutamyl-tRNA(Asn/Gln) amidotransferase C subunit